MKSLILDMDGVIWKEDTPIGDLPTIFKRVRQQGLKFTFVTNNGTKTPEQYVDRLAKYGVFVEPWQVITSALGVADLISKKIPAGSPIFAIGEIGLLEALRGRGFNLLSIEEARRAQAVVIGLDHQINFEKMSEATLLVRRGVPFYATNPDKTFPTPRGEIPGAGAWNSVIVIASGVQPIYAGKPSPTLIDMARQRLGTSIEDTLVIGDRLETDIAGGQAAGCPVALVLSGVSTIEQAKAWMPEINFITADLGSLIDTLISNCL